MRNSAEIQRWYGTEALCYLLLSEHEDNNQEIKEESKKSNEEKSYGRQYVASGMHEEFLSSWWRSIFNHSILTHCSVTGVAPTWSRHKIYYGAI